MGKLGNVWGEPVEAFGVGEVWAFGLWFELSKSVEPIISDMKFTICIRSFIP